MVDFKLKDCYNIHDLVDIMRLLREPGGCPWDAQQTHESIKKNLIEETYEVVEAINKSDNVLLCEELGDLLMQVVFHAQMEQEARERRSRQEQERRRKVSQEQGRFAEKRNTEGINVVPDTDNWLKRKLGTLFND